ncbi:MAG: DUF2726 domain-containing protein [Oscillospiraceae bacterium]|nr:DUF2726 domain-containing protein [Oscillospiraceae bacterium]
MKCKVCGMESGKYPLCRSCNRKRETGEIIKCEKCGSWHHHDAPCLIPTAPTGSDGYLYDARKTLISQTEQRFFEAIKSAVPDGHHIFPQIDLASFIERTDGARYHNELFRIVDFLVTDANYSPLFIIEINDQTHLNKDRKERDEKVQKICEEAGIPILKLWTSYGVDPEYIKKRIGEILSSLPVARIHHFDQRSARPEIGNSAFTPTENQALPTPKAKKSGCYIATCVYGSYDHPQVWTLRRYRDEVLSTTRLGRGFIRAYYAISPSLVQWFGETKWFRSVCRPLLDRLVFKLRSKGIEDTPYTDRME